MIRIIVDSSSDYSATRANELNMDLVPLNINMDGKNYRDGYDISTQEFYDLLVSSENFPMTSQPTPQDFLDVFEDAKEKGDSVVVLALSSGLSGTFQSATLAKNMIDYEEIYLVDTLSATVGIRILAEYALKLRDEGKDAATIAKTIDEVKTRVKIFAAVDTLDYLYKGGRLSKATAAVGEMAKLKVIITVDADGKISVPAKCLGRNKTLATLTKIITDCEIDTNFPAYSVYAIGEENTAKLEEKLEAEGVKTTERCQIGSTIGAHVGPGAYGLIFITK